MRVLAAIEEPELARKILACLDLPARAPPLLPAAPDASVGHETGSWGEPAWELDQAAPDRDGPG